MWCFTHLKRRDFLKNWSSYSLILAMLSLVFPENIETNQMFQATKALKNHFLWTEMMTMVVTVTIQKKVLRVNPVHGEVGGVVKGENCEVVVVVVVGGEESKRKEPVKNKYCVLTTTLKTHLHSLQSMKGVLFHSTATTLFANLTESESYGN